MAIIPLINPSIKSESVDASYQRCLNMYMVAAGDSARSKNVLMPTSGLIEIVDLGGAACRGIITVGDYTYVVRDSDVYRLVINTYTRTATATLLGTIGTASGVVKFASNPTQIILVDGSTIGYIITISTGSLAAIADADFVGGSSVTFCDGYFFYNQPNTAYLRCSASNDGTSWDATDVATVESKPDNLVGLAVNKGEIWAFGSDTVEVWYDAANAVGLPFSPRIGSEIDIGCASLGSIVEMNNAIIWLDSRGYVVQSQISAYIRNQSSGYDLQIISTESLQSEMATYAVISDAVATSYLERGHLIYQITFPTEHKTWCYDCTTGTWFERGTYSEFYGEIREHLVQYCTRYNNNNICCGNLSGKIYIMSGDLYDDNGLAIRRIHVSAPIHSESRAIAVSSLILRMGSGMATVTGDGSTPQVSLRYSNDGSHTWSDYLARDMGDIGEYGRPISWNRLGIAREWVFELTITEPIMFSIIEGSIEADVTNYGNI